MTEPAQKTSALGKLLDNPRIAAAARDVGQLRKPIGGVASKPIDLSTDSQGANLSIFNQVFTGSGSVSAAVSFLGKDASIDAFGTGVPVKLGGSNLGMLEVLASFGLETSQSILNTGSGLTLSASAGASGHIKYQHYLPLDAAKSQLQGLQALVAGSRLPNLIDLSSPPSLGQVHRLDAKIDLDFGLEASLGYKFAGTQALDFAGDISLPLKLDLEATLKASVGLSMFEQMSLTVARAGQLESDSDWIRLRLQRSNERKLTFGASLALDMSYNLSDGLVQLFEEALNQVPVPRLVTTASAITSMLASGDWDTIKTRLTGELAETVEDYIGDKGWLDLAANDPRVKKLIRLSGQIVAAYDGVDARVESLWDRMLSAASLEPGSDVRTWLEDLAGLSGGTFQIEDLLSGDAQKWVQAIETLSGRSLEQLVLSGEVGSEIKKVSGLAQQALDFLTKTPQKVIAEIQGFTEKTGIRKTVDVLRQFDSVEALQQTASARIQSLSSRIVGKAFDQIDAQDLTKIQKFAGRLLPYIPDPGAAGTKANQLRTKIRSNLEKVNLDYGFSVSLELERVSRSTALLDVELNPGNTKKLRNFRHHLSEALRGGDARRVIEEMAQAIDLVETKDPEVSEQPPDPSKAPFLIRESVFTSERIRSSAVSTVIDLAGLSKLFKGKRSGYTRQVEQVSVRIADRMVSEPSSLTGTRDPNRFTRTGRYSAGFQRGERTDDLVTETSLWLITEDHGTGLRLDRRYNAEAPNQFLRIAFSWQDTAKQYETRAIMLLLHQLGYRAVDPPKAKAAKSPAVPDAQALSNDPSLLLGQSVRFAFEMQFPATALRAFLGLAKDEGRWNRAFINACYRWANEGFVEQGVPDLSPLDSTGNVLKGIFADPLFLDHWQSVGGFFGSSEVMDRGYFTVPAGGGTASVPIGRQNRPTPLTGYLMQVIKRRKLGFEALGELADVRLDQRTDQAYRRLSRAFVRTAKRSVVTSLRWPNSTFAIWLWIAGLVFTDPKLLGEAKGMASLRWRDPATGSDDWTGPALWLVEGIPNDFVPGVLPIPEG